ncbi:Rhodanese-related sulfurtransferase [Salinimicrobium catena]|uniref:Rhodanese-related sulfurtransferase n=1 Tax=Salinimicrobium catena TaxID=390640 RepID=A0A1H5MVJ3_9FLAO|nr:rhodanese-like domain-containing protein [Salinimicrobium catena]SDL30307.1 Rhodanese-related sulfurtransferase [Salinimicrobium catena]SEE93180.1 Rhodanese-related sulfurtransferase [Salinimicrobium catena]
MKKILVAVILFLGVSAAFAQSSAEISVIEVKEYDQKIKKKEVQLVDVRTPEEFKEGHIKGARNIDFFSEDFIEQFQGMEKNEPLYIYCRSGNRSAKASKKLSKAGFKKIIDLEGGYKAWAAEKK